MILYVKDLFSTAAILPGDSAFSTYVTSDTVGSLYRLCCTKKNRTLKACNLMSIWLLWEKKVCCSTKHTVEGLFEPLDEYMELCSIAMKKILFQAI